ncbi:MAG TPA: flavin reductase family protein [Rhizomicrobium sp.]|nr:flavin reductase family protein [Rhizomicrobium sp.]
MSLRTIAKAVLRPVPQWAPVGIIPPQGAISVSLLWNGKAADVTENHTIASLKPVTVAIGLDGTTHDLASGTLEFVDTTTRKPIGSLQISRVAGRNTGGAQIGFFRIVEADHCCLPWPQRPWNAVLQARAIRKYKKPHNFHMPPAAVQQLMIFYICPRPVVLVSVSEGRHSNLFPMDLIGPLANGYFTLALRNTSVSVPAMVKAPRLAISGMPAEHKDVVYKLGEHHKKQFVDWDKLPLPVILTEKLKLPAIGSALWIRELSVEASEVIGSHTFFTCRVVSERQLSSGLQLHHTAGFHQEFRRRRGKPFAPA